LLDRAGAPRICYNRLVALLKKLAKREGFDVRKTLNRETLMRRLERKCKARPIIENETINERQVFRFQFHQMLQDLINSSGEHLQEIVPDHQINKEPPPESEHELWNTTWMKETFQMEEYKDFNSLTDRMLPVILYMDKTGTDVNQRYSLEPVLFSVAAIPREQRESRHSWRHLGFIPQGVSSSEEETLTSLQTYHDSLAYLMDGLRESQKKPPTLLFKSADGVIVPRRTFTPLMIVMGDQLSQDTLCGRLKSNSGGAGRVHRKCMCSYLNIDDPYHKCRKVNVATLKLLTTYATKTEEEIDRSISSMASFLPCPEDRKKVKTFLTKQRSMFRMILRHPYSMHPIKNAFEGINFGSWTSGIHEATVDDFMHSVEGGMISYIAETVYDGLTKKENDTVEESTRSLLGNHCCSVISNYPRWRLQPGFTRQTLMTSGERVGSILALSLSLHDPRIRQTIRSGHQRQIQKYINVDNESALEKKKRESNETMNKNTSTPPPPPEFYLNQHVHALDDDSIEHTLEHMLRHGFNVDVMMKDLDPFQINQLIYQFCDFFKNVQYPASYPSKDVKGLYTDLQDRSLIPEDVFRRVKYAMCTQPSKFLRKHRHRVVEGSIKKHHLKKINKKGEGSSAAILTENMTTLVIFLEYVLCYHAFCKYSWSLPVFLQQMHDNIKAGNRFVVEYFQKLIYRGNATVDCRFPKLHSQCQIEKNIQELKTVMNFCCETGERLLKTEAKGISRTAQQRGSTTFLYQTMSRLQERLVLDCFDSFLEKKHESVGSSSSPSDRDDKVDKVGRCIPHFIYEVAIDQIHAFSRKNELRQIDETTGTLAAEITDALKKHLPNMSRFEIYNEVILRDKSRLRASPNYSNSGPWYDYANVSWEQESDGKESTYLLPAKCLCFFRKHSPETADTNEIMALIHTVDQSSVGKCPGRADTLLTRNYRMQYNNKGEPVTHVVPIGSVDSCIRCFPHLPSESLFDKDSLWIIYLLPRNDWAYMWMAVNDVLQEANSPTKLRQRRGRLIPLSSAQWIASVRKKYKTYLEATCTSDIKKQL